MQAVTKVASYTAYQQKWDTLILKIVGAVELEMMEVIGVTLVCVVGVIIIFNETILYFAFYS